MYYIEYTDNAKKQLKKIKDKNYLKKLSRIIDNILKNPFSGIGKPEPLKYELTGFYSRRIDSKNRVVYILVEPNVIIISIVGHY
jgi:toxin YoeB